jgi:chromosome condensin MukBEF complex kleisin-like MukF subunit
VIVRLMHAGQYRVDDSLHDRLNELDDKALAAVEAGDEEALDGYLDEMWELVRSNGEELPAESLDASDVIIPPSDLTLAETRALMSGDGLIPDIPV